jgi:hypothetical protein
MIERDELDAEMASLERQKAETERQRSEMDAMLARIGGALAVVRHLIDKSSAKAIKAKQAACDAAAEAGGGPA